MTNLEEQFMCTEFLTKHIDEVISQLQAWKEEGIEFVYMKNKKGKYDYFQMNVIEDPDYMKFATLDDTCDDKPFVLITNL